MVSVISCVVSDPVEDLALSPLLHDAAKTAHSESAKPLPKMLYFILFDASCYMVQKPGAIMRPGSLTQIH